MYPLLVFTKFTSIKPFVVFTTKNSTWNLKTIGIRSSLSCEPHFITVFIWYVKLCRQNFWYFINIPFVWFVKALCWLDNQNSKFTQIWYLARVTIYRKIYYENHDNIKLHTNIQFNVFHIHFILHTWYVPSSFIRLSRQTIS